MQRSTVVGFARCPAIAVALAMSVAAVAMSSGCSRPKVADLSSQAPKTRDGLAEYKALLEQAASGGEKAPASKEAFMTVEPAWPILGPFVMNGSIECVWGAKLATGPDAAKRIVAFEANAPKEGGFVLLQDGTVKEVSAAEFGSLEKAKP